MRLLLSLMVVVTLTKAARIPREVHPHFPNFHQVHHGHGATSYQNVQLENYGSVPIPVETHHEHHQHHNEVEQHHVAVHLHEEPHYAHHDEHNEISSVTVAPEIENHHHHQPFIIIAKDPHEVSSQNIGHEDGQHYILLEVPYTENEHEQAELHDGSQLQYYSDNYEHGHEHGHEHEHEHGHEHEYE